MGSYQQLYVGPYVTCKQRPGTRKEEIRSCLNAQCSHHGKPPHRRNAHHGGDDKFCARCGGAIGPFTIEKKNRVTPYDVVNDELSWINPDEYERDSPIVTLGTNTTKTPRDFTPEPEGAHLDILAVDIKAEIDWFVANHAEVIERLREVYDDVKVSWGVHSYCH